MQLTKCGAPRTDRPLPEKASFFCYSCDVRRSPRDAGRKTDRSEGSAGTTDATPIATWAVATIRATPASRPDRERALPPSSARRYRILRAAKGSAFDVLPTQHRTSTRRRATSRRATPTAGRATAATIPRAAPAQPMTQHLVQAPHLPTNAPATLLLTRLPRQIASCSTQAPRPRTFAALLTTPASPRYQKIRTTGRAETRCTSTARGTPFRPATVCWRGPTRTSPSTVATTRRTRVVTNLSDRYVSVSPDIYPDWHLPLSPPSRKRRRATARLRRNPRYYRGRSTRP